MDARLATSRQATCGLAPVAQNTDADRTAGGLLRNQHNDVCALCAIGEIDTGVTAKFYLEESDDDSTYIELCNSGNLTSANWPWVGSLSAKPTKAWVRVRLTASGTDETHGLTACAFLILGDGPYQPETNENAVFS